MIANPYTAYKRISRGWSHEDAWSCPAGEPLWAYRSKTETGLPLVEFLKIEARRAKVTGECLESVAASLDLSADNLGHYCRRHGIRWPIGVSRYQREVATATIQAVNRARKRGPGLRGSARPSE